MIGAWYFTSACSYIPGATYIEHPVPHAVNVCLYYVFYTCTCTYLAVHIFVLQRRCVARSIVLTTLLFPPM